MMFGAKKKLMIFPMDPLAKAAAATAAATAAAAYCRGCLLYREDIFLWYFYVWEELGRSHISSHPCHG
jgi:hypothetical protein